MKIVGIDLGTTNSVVAVYERGLVRTLSIFGYKTTPSVVCWNPRNGEMLVGHNAKKRILINPETTISSNKRFIGDRTKTYSVLGKTYTSIQISAFILKYLIEGASEALGEVINKAIITVPAYFTQNQKEDTKEAAELAGIEVVKLQHEPTAAAIAYGWDKDKDQILVIYDLGGGTFDVSILEVKGNRFKVKAVGGDINLGGDNFDEAIVEHLYQEIYEELGVDICKRKDIEAQKVKQRLKELAEQAKIELSQSNKADNILMTDILGYGSFEYTLTRKIFQRLIVKDINETIDILKSTIQEADIDDDDINRIVCVGGSTQIPLVKETISKYLRVPYQAKNVAEVVAHGAAITTVSKHITNVTPYNLGIQLEEDRFGIIIEKNSTLPITVEKEYTITTDYATSINIVIYQGDAKYCKDNILLGGFRLSGIIPVKAGKGKVIVSFTLDDNDILTINAKDILSNKTNTITIDGYEPSKEGIGDIYTEHIGQNHIPGALTDQYGNAKGNEHDLVKDYAFNGLQIGVLHLYTGEGFDFQKPEMALREKGFKIIRWQNAPPSASELRKTLEKCCQLWIISNRIKLLNNQHLQVIKDFFHQGKGVYIWGDNDPFYADANFISEEILGVSMSGNVMGDQTVNLQDKTNNYKVGLLPKHPISTGLQYIYEGITIATIQNHSDFTPLIYGSARNLVTAIYDTNGRRAIIDGGFTRLFLKWDTAGTGRYVKNAAAWLVNYERFKEKYNL